MVAENGLFHFVQQRRMRKYNLIYARMNQSIPYGTKQDE